MNCNKCGAPLNASDQFCAHCGAPTVVGFATVGVATQAEAHGNLEGHKKTTKFIILAAIAIPICILAIIIPILLGGGNSNNQSRNGGGAITNISTSGNGDDNPAPQLTVPQIPSERITEAAPTLEFTNMPASDSQIAADIQSNDYLITQNGFWFDGMSIVKRQTDVDNKTDRVFVQWTTHNDVCSIQNEGELLYVLYNEGWLFENIDSRRTGTTILSSDVSSYDAEEKAKDSYIPHKYDNSGYISLVDRQTNLEAGEDIFVYEYKLYFYYCTMTYTAKVKFKFGSIEWYYDSVDWNDGVADWDIVGQWACRNKDAQVWLNILSFDGTSGTVEYSIKFDYEGWYYYGVQTFHTDEAVSVYARKQTDTDRNDYLEIELPTRNASSEHAEAGYLKLYPSRMYWNSLHAKTNTYVMERSDGQLSTALSELFSTEKNHYWYWPLSYTDPAGETHNSYYEFASYVSTWNSDIESFIDCELAQQYFTITGTYFCDPKMPADVGISLYIYADGVCVYQDEHLYLGDGIHTFSADISGADTLRISVICDDEHYYCGLDEPEPTIILVDTFLD